MRIFSAALHKTMNKVCIMALDKTLSAEGLQAVDLLKTSLENIFEGVSAKEYSSLPPLLGQLGEKLSQNKAVIIAATPSVFYGTKQSLQKALSLKSERNDEVTASLPPTYFSKSREEYEIVTGFPTGSKIFMTHDGFLSGFSIQSGKQTILFLPLDSNRLFPMLRDDVFPYLKNLFPAAPKPAPAPVNLPVDDELFEVEELGNISDADAVRSPASLYAAASAATAPEAEIVSNSVQAEDDGPDFDVPDSDGPDFDVPDSDGPDFDVSDSDGPDFDVPDSDGPDFDVPDSDGPDFDVPDSDGPDFDNPANEPPVEEPPVVLDPLTVALHRAVTVLNGGAKRVSVAACGPVEGLRNLLQAVPNSDMAFVFDAEPAAKWNTGEFNPYFAEVAKTTLKRCGTDFAVAVSALYSDGDKDEKFMFFVLATEQGAKISKIADAEADVVACNCLQAMAEAIEEKAAGSQPALSVISMEDNAPAAATPSYAAPAAAPASPAAIEEPAEEKSPVTVSKVPLAIAAVLLGLAIVAAVALGFWMSTRDSAAETAAPTSAVSEVSLPSTTAAPASVSLIEPESTSEESTEENGYGEDFSDEDASLEGDENGYEDENEEQ